MARITARLRRLQEQGICVSIINDEVSTDIDATIEFLKNNGMSNVELRAINGRNLLDFTLGEVEELAALLRRNNITVTALASPLFKWHPEGFSTTNTSKADTFFFNPYITVQEKQAYIVKAVEIANVLGTDYVRVFSSLEGPQSASYSFMSDSLLGFALREARAGNVQLLLENEMPCHIRTPDQVRRVVETLQDGNLGVLFDIANFYRVRERVFYDTIASLRDSIRYFHIKDVDMATGAYVPVGQGRINYKRVISDIRKIFGETGITLSLETHVREDAVEANRKSLRALCELLEEPRLGYGIVGCGQSFFNHGGVIQTAKGSEIRAVFDVDARRAKCAVDLGDYEEKADLETMLNDPNIDVINIRTPHSTHGGIVVDALRAGKYVLCEKPLCLTAEEGRAILEVEQGVEVFTLLQNRFNPAVQFLLEQISSGRLGEVRFYSTNVRGSRDDQYFIDRWHGNVDMAGGMLFNQGAHALDIMLKVCGDPRKVTALKKPLRQHSGVDDVYVANVEFANGIIGNVEVTTYAQGGYTSAEIFVLGDRGSIQVAGPFLNKVNFLSVDNNAIDLGKPPRFDKRQSHLELIDALNRHIRNGTEDPRLSSATEGIRLTEFIELLYKEAR